MNQSNTKSNKEIKNIAVVGSGIAGLIAAWLLSKKYSVTLFESNNYVGGHSNTVEVSSNNNSYNIDTGFVVFNTNNYPNLCQLLDHLNIKSVDSNMSFSVSMGDPNLEYCSNGFDGFFAQRKNIFAISHWRMLIDLLRFYNSGRQFVNIDDHQKTVGDFLYECNYSKKFIEYHILPMIGAIWSVPLSTATDFPISSVFSFFNNHALLQFRNRPIWKTIKDGSRSYVTKLVQDMNASIFCNREVVKVIRDSNDILVEDHLGNRESFDAVIIATHADEALTILDHPTTLEKELLGSIKYQENRAVLHKDPLLMPRRKKAWSSWNVLKPNLNSNNINVTYWMNNLHKIKNFPDIFLTLNPVIEPNKDSIEREFLYHHPIITSSAILARKKLDLLQGQGNIWFCGSYFGYGFHEDALLSGIKVARYFGVRQPW